MAVRTDISFLDIKHFIIIFQLLCKIFFQARLLVALTYIIKCPSAFSDLDALFHDAHVTEFLLLGVRLAADVAVLGVGHVAVGEGDLARRGRAGGGLDIARYGAANLQPDLREIRGKEAK